MGKGENVIYETILTVYNTSLNLVVNATGYSISSSKKLPQVQIRHCGETETTILWRPRQEDSNFYSISVKQEQWN